MPQTSFMDAALAEAKAAADRGEVPVGAVIVQDQRIIARAGNQTKQSNDPTGHAEIMALRMASEKLGTDRLTDCDLYVTLEPCTMCAGAIAHARIRRLYFGATDEKGGAVVSGVRFFEAPTCHHAPDVYGGMAESEAAAILTRFFQTRR